MIIEYYLFKSRCCYKNAITNSKLDANKSDEYNYHHEIKNKALTVYFKYESSLKFVKSIYYKYGDDAPLLHHIITCCFINDQRPSLEFIISKNLFENNYRLKMIANYLCRKNNLDLLKLLFKIKNCFHFKLVNTCLEHGSWKTLNWLKQNFEFNGKIILMNPDNIYLTDERWLLQEHYFCFSSI